MFVEKIQPRFSEMNPAGHIGFTVLPAWFEQAAEKVYRIFMPDLDKESWSIIVAKFAMECLAEIHHGQEISIETSIKKIGNSSFIVYQELVQNQKTAAKAEITMVRYNYSMGKSWPLTDEQKKVLSSHGSHDSAG